jgi:hypothetical protein
LTIHSNGKAAEWFVGRSQARTDRVPEVMLEKEVELQLLLTSIFDRLSRSESDDVATAFEMYEGIQREYANKIYPNNAFQCVLPHSLNDVSRLYLKNKYARKSSPPCVTIHKVDNHAYMAIQDLLTVLSEMGYKLDGISPIEDSPEIRPEDLVSRIPNTRRARKMSLPCNDTYKGEEK